MHEHLQKLNTMDKHDSWVVGRGPNHLNVLRLTLAIFVIISHSYHISNTRNLDPLEIITRIFSLGGIAVDFFFLISGFLIMKSWDRKPEITSFLKNRFFRIFPGYIVAVTLSVVGCGILLSAPWSGLFSERIVALLFSIVTLSQPVTPFEFTGTRYPAINVSLWSIRYEFMCYLLVPALMSLRDRKRLIPLLAVALMALDAIGRVSMQHSGQLAVMAGSLVRLTMFFTVGGCFYLFQMGVRVSFLALTTSTIILGAVAYFQIKPIADPVLAVFGGYIIFSLAWAPFPAMSRFSDFDISYGTYLYGWPISKVLYFLYPEMSAASNATSSVFLALIAGLLSWTLVEIHFIKHRRLGPNGFADTSRSTLLQNIPFGSAAHERRQNLPTLTQNVNNMPTARAPSDYGQELEELQFAPHSAF